MSGSLIWINFNRLELFMDNGCSFRFEENAKKKNGFVMYMEANAKESNYVEVIFDNCGQRFHDRPLRNGVACRLDKRGRSGIVRI